jgi:pSer/pThr/pTyr-binding forkhead associated (FHA) protein
MANAAGDSVVLAPRIKLLVTEGPCAGQVLEPKASLACLSIGRTRASKLHVKDPSVSERHGEVSWSGKAWVLKDLGSSNGTVVNGRRLVPERR